MTSYNRPSGSGSHTLSRNKGPTGSSRIRQRRIADNRVAFAEDQMWLPSQAITMESLAGYAKLIVSSEIPGQTLKEVSDIDEFEQKSFSSHRTLARCQQ